jgi:hypothetical protein
MAKKPLGHDLALTSRGFDLDPSGNNSATDFTIRELRLIRRISFFPFYLKATISGVWQFEY